MPPGGSLFRGAALGVPDDSLHAGQRRRPQPSTRVRIPGEKTSLTHQLVLQRQLFGTLPKGAAQGVATGLRLSIEAMRSRRSSTRRPTTAVAVLGAVPDRAARRSSLRAPYLGTTPLTEVAEVEAEDVVADDDADAAA